jgi:hypothetical protein
MTNRRSSSAYLSSRELWLILAVYAACAYGDVNPDSWFPVSVDTDAARREAADALAVCSACLVRAHCLELSLRHWTIGQHGIWGGTLPSERKALLDRRAAVRRRAGAAARVARRQ